MAGEKNKNEEQKKRFDEEKRFDKIHKGLKLTKKQKEFLRIIGSNALNVSDACKKLYMSRTLYNTWLSNNEDFREAVSNIEESEVDFGETLLKRRMIKDSDSSIQFFLRSKGKHRGYGNDQQINLKVDRPDGLNHLSDDDLDRLIAQKEIASKK